MTNNTAFQKIISHSFTLLLLSITISCSTAYYTEPTIGPTASVSFSNLSPERPDIYIISHCRTLAIESKLIEQRKPQVKSKHKIFIPADKVLSFKYEYNFLINKRNQPVTYEGNLSSRIKIEKTGYVSTCNSLVSFKPDQDRHYEVYFGLLNESCIIKVDESVISDISGKKQLHSIPFTRGNNCVKK